jgi:hypothetical protein
MCCNGRTGPILKAGFATGGYADGAISRHRAEKPPFLRSCANTIGQNAGFPASMRSAGIEKDRRANADLSPMRVDHLNQVRAVRL